MRAAAMLVLALWLGGCGGARPPLVADVATRPDTATSPALRVAADLAAAAQAEADRDGPALIAAVTRLRNRGVQPLDVAAEASLARWSAVTGAAANPLRGRALGPGFRRDTLAPGESRVLEQVFLAGKPAEISLGGSRNSSLRLTLRDAKTRAVCEHDPASGRSCRFTPLFSQRYGIEIANGGQSDETYFLVFD